MIKSRIKIQKKKNLHVGKLGENKDYKEITNAGCGEKRPLVHCWWEWKLVQSLLKTYWRILKKFKIELPSDRATPLLRTYPKVRKTRTQNHICTAMSTALVCTRHDMETTRVSTEGRAEKDAVAHIQ